MWAGEHLLAYGFVPTPDEVEQKIEAVTPDEVRELAGEFFRDNRLNAAVITAAKNERAVDELLTFS
jgi:predicted Zn-dependent peptidase